VKRHQILWIGAFLASFMVFAITGFWCGWRCRDASNAAEECRSDSKFAQLRVMLHAYHDEHGTFPPGRYQPQADGPKHSWRVLLMPYTNRDNRERYSKYDFSQAWNSRTNLQAVGDVRYSVGFGLDPNSNIANYLTIGEEGWPSGRPLKSRLITKGKDSFLVVEDPDSQIHWMEPRY